MVPVRCGATILPRALEQGLHVDPMSWPRTHALVLRGWRSMLLQPERMQLWQRDTMPTK